MSMQFDLPGRTLRLRTGDSRGDLPSDFDPWAVVPYTAVPADIVAAVEQEDWTRVREQLRTLMDGVTTDGEYGRQLLQLVRRLPLGVDPLFDRYRAVIALDYGDWDDLQAALRARPLERMELEGVRDIWLAPVTQRTIPTTSARHQIALFEVHEYQLQRNWWAFRRWARRMMNSQFADVVWDREDIPTTRHLLYRRLQDVVLLAVAEANGGRLSVAASLSREGQRLGGEREQLRILAADLESLVQVAMGKAGRLGISWPRQVASPTGFSPLGAWELLCHLLPFMMLLDDDSFGWTVQVVDRISARMGSPRAQLHSESWRVALQMIQGTQPDDTELDGLLVQARPAVPGLRVLPQLLDGYARPRHSAFAEALDLARRAGNMWAQISSLVWLTALNPTPWTSRSLHRLLEVTGWRRPLFVPPQIAADAALGLTTAGLRGRAIVELALLAGRPNVTVEVASRHVDDERATIEARIAAVHALGKLGTSRSRELLERVARRKDDLGVEARTLTARPATGVLLSEREIEVLGLAARGQTNKEIGGQLGLSEHTVARHVANARNKLGAANRAEAVSRLAEISRS